jgi:flagellar motor protein MotB
MSKKTQKKQEGGKPKVPGYIVTYSDMITLLLTFFVMLLSLANQQDPQLFDVGRDSFVKSVKNLGLGMLMGPKVRAELSEENLEHHLKEVDSRNDKRIIDAQRERMRRVYEKIKEKLDCSPPQITGKKVNFSVTPIKFSSANTKLNEEAKTYLKSFCSNISDSLKNNPQFYVLGLAADIKNSKKSWITSSERAKKTADFLEKQLHEECEVYCWGTGQGGKWAGQENYSRDKVHILIGIIQK